MERKVFMIMPFSNKIAEDAYKLSIKPICESHNLLIRRADEIFSTKPIYDDIVKEIKDASIIIVDITDKNMNVYYELGMAHILKQNQTIMITQGEYSSTPFDIAHFRIIKYENSLQGKDKLEKELDLTLRTLLVDYKTINREEYELVLNVLLAGSQIAQLATILGIRDFKGVIKLSDRFEIDYAYKTRIYYQASSIQKEAEIWIKLGYLRVENELVTLTEEGRAFAEFVESNGIKCSMFNDQAFVENHISHKELLIERSKLKKAEVKGQQ